MGGPSGSGSPEGITIFAGDFVPRYLVRWKGGLIVRESKEYKSDLQRGEPKANSPNREVVRQVTSEQNGGEFARKRFNRNVGRGPFCSKCGIEKRLANHWFKASSGDDYIMIQAFGKSVTGRATEWRPLCGDECVQKETAEWLFFAKMGPGKSTPQSQTS